MSSMQDYIKQTMLFSNSLVIKLNDLAIAINKGLILKYHDPSYVSSDPREWKYYLNISGKRHISNSDVKIKVIETNTLHSLNPSLLEKHPYTKKELLKNTDYYNTLIAEYPDDELYIKGCLYPVDIDTALNAEDGTILAYNPTFVEPNEYSLIRELEDWVKSYIVRWHVKAYMLADDLYIPSVLAVLYANIPNKIMNIRMDKIYTNEVHSFHMQEFFNSHLELWENISILKPHTKMWLYNNLKYLIKHTGKEETFRLIIDKVFEENSIGVGEYKLRVPDQIEYDPDKRNPSDVSRTTFENQDQLAITKSLNSYYNIKENTEVSIETLVNMEINSLEFLTELNMEHKYEYIVKRVKETVNKQFMDNQKTKVLDIAINDIFKRYGLDLFNIIIDHWALFVFKDKYSSTVEFNPNETIGYSKYNKNRIEPLIDYTDPNNNVTYSITPRTGLIMLFKLLKLLTGNKDMKLKNYKLSCVLDPDPTVLDTMYSKMYKDGYTDILIPEFKKNYPSVFRTINVPEDFKEFILEVIGFYSYIWTIDCNSESIFTSFSIKDLFRYTMLKNEFYFTDIEEGEDIDKLLKDANVEYNISGSDDIVSSIQAIILAFTGIQVDEYMDIRAILYHAKEILNKLTSYTVHVVTEVNDNKSYKIMYNNTGVLRTKNGLIATSEAELVPCEPEHTLIEARALNWIENSFSTKFTWYPTIKFGTKIIEGSGVHNVNPTTDSVHRIDVHDDTVYSVYETSNLIKSVTIGFDPSDMSYSNIAGLNNPWIKDGWASIYHYDIKNISFCDNSIEGLGYYYPDSRSYLEPSTYVYLYRDDIIEHNLCQRENKFLLHVSATYDPLDTNIGENAAMYKDWKNTGSYTIEPSFDIKNIKYKVHNIIEGYVSNEDTKDMDMSIPNTRIDIDNDSEIHVDELTNKYLLGIKVSYEPTVPTVMSTETEWSDWKEGYKSFNKMIDGIKFTKLEYDSIIGNVSYDKPITDSTIPTTRVEFEETDKHVIENTTNKFLLGIEADYEPTSPGSVTTMTDWSNWEEGYKSFNKTLDSIKSTKLEYDSIIGSVSYDSPISDSTIPIMRVEFEEVDKHVIERNSNKFLLGIEANYEPKGHEDISAITGTSNNNYTEVDKIVTGKQDLKMTVESDTDFDLLNIVPTNTSIKIEDE